MQSDDSETDKNYATNTMNSAVVVLLSSMASVQRLNQSRSASVSIYLVPSHSLRGVCEVELASAELEQIRLSLLFTHQRWSEKIVHLRDPMSEGCFRPNTE